MNSKMLIIVGAYTNYRLSNSKFRHEKVTTQHLRRELIIVVRVSAAHYYCLARWQKLVQCRFGVEISHFVSVLSRLASIMVSPWAQIELRLHVQEALSHLLLSGWQNNDQGRILPDSLQEAFVSIAIDCDGDSEHKHKFSEDGFTFKDLQARALADIQLHDLGFSALTCEKFPRRNRDQRQDKAMMHRLLSPLAGQRLSLEQRLPPQLAPIQYAVRKLLGVGTILPECWYR